MCTHTHMQRHTHIHTHTRKYYLLYVEDELISSEGNIHDYKNPIKKSVSYYQRNANQNHNEVPVHTSQDGCYPKVYKQ